MKLVKQKKEFKLDFSKYEGQIVGPPLPALPSVLSPATAVLKAPARHLLKSLNTWLSDWTTRYPEV